MNYTQDQLLALDQMESWANTVPTNEEDYLYTLDGAAGTGKTTIAKEFLNRIKIPRTKIAVTAPTHKAKKQIQKSTGYVGETIQKLMGLRPDVNIDKFDVNNPTFNPLAEVTLRFFKVVLIDESSMLNSDLYDELKKKAFKHKVKILFLGDSFQLPPINEDMSKVFKSVKNKSTLRTIVRQSSDSPMVIALQKLREDIQKGSTKGLEYITTTKFDVNGEKGFMCLPINSNDGGKLNFGQELLKLYFSSEYKVNKDFVKFIAYTNDSVEKWSEALRKQILKEDAKNLINEGELLVGYNTITDRKLNSVIIENSEDYIVTNVTEATSSYGIPGFDVTLENEKGFSRDVFIIDHNNVDKFKQICQEKLHLAKTQRGKYWVHYFTFKNNHLCLVNIYKNENAGNTFGNLLCKKDIYYGYGVTVHKSQGSTYNNVGINLLDLYKNYNESERARLIYVAMSRARNMNLILVN